MGLAHHFQSAFTADQVYRYLRIPMPRHAFDAAVEELISEKRLVCIGGMLLSSNTDAICQEKRQWSRALFEREKAALKIVAGIPWVRFLALTGANAFESCQHEDDLDLFMITSRNRLWLCYALMVLVSKLLRRRRVWCLNFLVDEEHLQQQRDYFTAVQIMQMIPLIESAPGNELLQQNSWIPEVLPNAILKANADPHYFLGRARRVTPLRWLDPLLTYLNERVFRYYRRRLQRKFPEAFGEGIRLGSGVAKLNRIDHQDLYEKIYADLYRKLEEVFPL